jgi:hypothetical protein
MIKSRFSAYFASLLRCIEDNNTIRCFVLLSIFSYSRIEKDYIVDKGRAILVFGYEIWSWDGRK